MTAIATPGQGGYGWRMTDSDRLNRRVERLAVKRAPARLGSELPAVVETIARRNMANPNNFRPATDEEMQAAEDRIRREHFARKAEILLSRIHGDYKRATLPKSPEGQLAAQWVENYRRGDRCNLVILGPLGTGKTWLAAAIAVSLLTGPRPIPVTLTTVAEMLDVLRPGRNGLDTDMIQFTGTPVLILDDLGAENSSSWTAEQLYKLAHYRSHNNLPTIMTSNLKGKDFRDAYDTRTFERLFGGAKLIELIGCSRRETPF